MIAKTTRFLIVGLGLMGGSYARALKQHGYAVDAIDQDASSIAYAVQQGFLDHDNLISDRERIGMADLIILALYPANVISWLRENQAFIKPNTLILDICGVKTPVINQISSFLRPDLEFLGTHPMAGKEVQGVKYSDANLFFQANLIITPSARTSPRALEIAHEIGNLLGFQRISMLTAEEHDELIGYLSQLTHVIAVCLMNSRESDHLIAYTGDSFRDLTRIAKINENLWSELFLMNKDFLLKEIDGFLAEMHDFRHLLATEDAEGMKERFRQSTARRTAFDK